MTDLSVGELLAVCGADGLEDAAPAEAREQVLRNVADRLNGADSLRRATVRQALKDRGFPVYMIDPALEALPARDNVSSEAAPPPESELRRDAANVLGGSDILAELRRDVRKLGYAGSTAPVEILFVAITSRLDERPINIAVRAQSAAGKTHSVDTAKRFFPDDVVHDLTGMSERALIYSDFPTANRYVEIAEAAALSRDGVGASIVRGLAWGHGIRYETVEKDADGHLVAREIVRPGPTGLITTSTKDLDPEIATRMLSVTISDSPEQTRAILDSQGRAQAGDGPQPPNLERWHAAARWLEHYGAEDVVIPYAPDVARAVPVIDVRMRRDFQQIMSVIRAHARLHQWNRATDGRGRVIATRDDYAAAHRLLAKTLAVTIDAVSEEARETFAKVAELTEATEGRSPVWPAGVSYAALGEELGLSSSGARYRCRDLLKARHLVNREEKKGYPARIVTGDPMPEDRAVLPAPEDIRFHDPENRLRACGPPEDGADLCIDRPRSEPTAHPEPRSAGSDPRSEPTAGFKSQTYAPNRATPQPRSEIQGGTGGTHMDGVDGGDAHGA